MRSLREEGPASETSVSFDGLMRPHVLRKMAFEHFIADFAMESFDVFMVARDVLFQCVSPVESFRANMADEVPLIQMALKSTQSVFKSQAAFSFLFTLR